MARLLVIDNYDSFTYNLVQMFMRYDLEIHVHRADRIGLEDIIGYGPDYILISPGPRDPAHAGISVPLIREFYKRIPILGVCLGMQCINEAFGGRTLRSPRPMHGKTSLIRHYGIGVFEGIPAPFSAARYHSLICGRITDELIITARSDDNIIMGLSHPSCHLHGVQFHPESFLTEHGFTLIENFLALGGMGKAPAHG